MALRAKTPENISKRLKMLVYGPAGVGKTMAAIQFPKPYLIDTERGAENDNYVKALKAAGGVYMFSNDPDEIIAETRVLISERHPYQTLIVDPFTTIYNDLLDKSAAMLATRDDPTGTSFSRHKGPADRKVKHLLALFTRLDMNIIVTAHSKTKWERDGKTIVDVGQTFDAFPKMDYLFDLVVEASKRGVDRVGIVKKTRIEAFPEGEVFPFSYAAIADRYGRALLEKNAVPVPLATTEQLIGLRLLLNDRADADALIEKWTEKAKVSALEDMTTDQISKCVNYLEKIKEAA